MDDLPIVIAASMLLGAYIVRLVLFTFILKSARAKKRKAWNAFSKAIVPNFLFAFIGSSFLGFFGGDLLIAESVGLSLGFFFPEFLAISKAVTAREKKREQEKKTTKQEQEIALVKKEFEKRMKELQANPKPKLRKKQPETGGTD